MFVKKAKRLVAGLCAFPLVITASCSTQDGVGRYRVQSIGQAQRSVEATVISARDAYISLETSGAGGAMGGALGGAIAGNNSDNAGVIIAGIIGGILIGNAIEATGNNIPATEYVIRTDYDVLLTVAQINKGNPIFSARNRVILVYGYPARLIPNPL
jgi:outer membrane lipoprotein SlyB